MLNVRGNKESPLSVPTLSSEIVDEKKIMMLDKTIRQLKNQPTNKHTGNNCKTKEQLKGEGWSL